MDVWLGYDCIRETIRVKRSSWKIANSVVKKRVSLTMAAFTKNPVLFARGYYN